MNPKLNLLLLFILCVSVSCSSFPATPEIQPTVQETNTPTAAASTITAMPSATLDPDSPEGCINLKPVDFNPTEINGLLVLYDTNSIIHLLDPKTNQFVDIDKDGNRIFNATYILSPNKKYMLAGSPTSEYLILKTADKEIITNVKISDSTQARWLDNEHVSYLSLKQPEQDLIVFNPFTGEQQTIHLDLPNAEIMEYSPSQRLVFYFIDPTLRRVIYNTKDGGVVLWNLETNKEMTSLAPPAESSFFSFQWSPDGTKFVTPFTDRFFAANELYMFSMDGKLEQLTHFSQKYSYASVELPAWSPDGQHIGFWLRIGDSNSDPRKLRQWLAVLDANTLETTIYCLADNPQPGEFSEIVWSPDGQQLIVSFGSHLKNNFKSILVDLKRQTQAAFDFDAQNMAVYDWMAP